MQMMSLRQLKKNKKPCVQLMGGGTRSDRRYGGRGGQSKMTGIIITAIICGTLIVLALIGKKR